jgi:hypothetical protein
MLLSSTLMNSSQNKRLLNVIDSNAKTIYALGNYMQPHLVIRTPRKFEHQFKLIHVTEFNTRDTETLMKSLYRLKSSLKFVLIQKSNPNQFKTTSKIDTASKYRTIKLTELKSMLQQSSMVLTKRLMLAFQNTAKKFNIRTLGAWFTWKLTLQ